MEGATTFGKVFAGDSFEKGTCELGIEGWMHLLGWEKKAKHSRLMN